MRRRAFVATAGAVALAGCTASGDDGRPDPRDYTLRGLEDSDVYTEAYIQQLELFDWEFMFGDGGLCIGLVYDAAAEYDPADHDVYLMDGERVVDEGEVANPFSNDEPAIVFDLYADDLEQTQTYRVVSMNVTDPADEFELEVVRDD